MEALDTRILWRNDAIHRGGLWMTLNANNAVPLYEQVKINLQSQMASRAFLPGQRLPSETELCQNFGVSRITVRRALDDLVNEGILERKQGKGTFVAERKSKIQIKPLNNLGGGFTDSKVPGIQQNTRLISKKVCTCSKMEMEILGLNPEDMVLVFDRLMLTDGTPMMLDHSVYPAQRFHGMFDQIQNDVSTYKILREQYGILSFRTQKEISIAYAEEEQASLLNCSVGAPLFRVFKQVHSEENEPIHFSILLFAADRTVFTYE